MPGDVRRIVTGHDSEGNAVIASDGRSPRVIDVSGRGTVFHEIWHTDAMPVPIPQANEEPQEEGLKLPPPKNGVRIRVVDFPPEPPDMKFDPAQSKELFAQMGAREASTHKAGGHPFMHRTETVDYGIVLEGEIVLMVDKGETLCRPGDIVIQRGTNHAWSNRSGKPARMAFVLIDGKFA